MATNLKIYVGNPTAGGTNGTAVSEGTGNTPITGTLLVTDISGAEAAVKCAIRTTSGYVAEGATILKTVTLDENNLAIDYVGTNVQLAADNSYADAAAALSGATWTNTLTLANVGATNTIFWVKFTAPAAANPINDTSVYIFHNAILTAVS